MFRWNSRVSALSIRKARSFAKRRLPAIPTALLAWFSALGLPLSRIGLEAGPLSQWLYAGLAKAGFAVELIETRHVRDAFKAIAAKMGQSVERRRCYPVRRMRCKAAGRAWQLRGFAAGTELDAVVTE